MNIKSISVFTAATAGLIFSAIGASVITPVNVYAHNQGRNFAGGIEDMTNGSGMTDATGSYNTSNPHPSIDSPSLNPDWAQTLPSTWTATDSDYWQEFSSRALLNSGTSDNAKIGWIIFDFGGPIEDLGEIYIWNVRSQTNEFVVDYNIYYSSTPTVAPTSGPTSGATDYIFDTTSGGWTEIATPSAMTNRNTAGFTNGEVNAVHGLGQVTAQYVGIEILSNTGDPNNTGLAEVGFTVVPEPSTTALLGLGGLALMLRRRR